MKISYDSKINTLYIQFIKNKHKCRTMRLNKKIALNIGAGEKLVGFEILDAKEVLGSGKIPLVTFEGIEPADAPLVLHDKPAKKYGS